MGGWMTYGRMRNRNGLSWRPAAGEGLYPSDPGGYPLPEAGSRFPARARCWVCDREVPADRVPLGTCGPYHQGVWDADRGSVGDRARPAPRRISWGPLLGDINRMERDYRDPPDELSQRCGDPSPAIETSMATGIDVDTVRAVLAHVFTASR